MYLTVEEASTRVCPVIRYCTNENAVGMSNAPPIMAHANCCASGCMSWRWAGGLEATEKGYCGLAGRPGPQILNLAEGGKITTIE